MGITIQAHEYNKLPIDQKLHIHELYTESNFSFDECIYAYVQNDCDKELARKYLEEHK